MIDPDHLKGFHQVPDIQNIEILETATEEEGEADTREREDMEKEGDGEIGASIEEGGELEDTEGRLGASIEEVEGAGEEAVLTTGGEDTVRKIIHHVHFDRLKPQERINYLDGLCQWEIFSFDIKLTMLL